MTTVAILGCGRMGSAIARRLRATGHQVTVWNRTPAAAEALADVGAAVAATPADAVADADLVITMVADAAAVRTVLFGSADADAAPAGDATGAGDGSPSGSLSDSTGQAAAVAALRPGAIVVQMSTISPDETEQIATRLPTTASFLDAPVGGSVNAVEAGTLTIFAGGSDAVIERAEPVLRHLGTIRRCGPVGAGTAIKLVVNTALVTALGALRDALAVADGVGVEQAVALDVLAAGPLGGAVRRATATGAAFPIYLAAKDARLALRYASTSAPVLEAVAQALQAAADQDADVASLISREKQ
mgnify:CR=1 FL=1